LDFVIFIEIEIHGIENVAGGKTLDTKFQTCFRAYNHESHFLKLRQIVMFISSTQTAQYIFINITSAIIIYLQSINQFVCQLIKQLK